MKIGIVSDAHGNKHGTKLCLDYLSGKIDELYFLGDSIGYFPDGSQVIELLLNANAKMIMGNHEAMLLGYLPLDSDRDKIYRIRQTGDSLNEQQWKEIKSLPTFIEKEIGDRKILFVHASPWDHLMGYVYPNSDLERFSSLTYDVIFMGHTHRPFSSDV